MPSLTAQTRRSDAFGLTNMARRRQYTPGVPPPSTATATPWICRAPGEHRNTARAAMSSGWAMLRTPERCMICCRISSTVLPRACARCAHNVVVRSVSVVPGWMALTLTPSRLPSWERPLLNVAMAPLTEEPIRNSGSGVRAAPPITLTTWPCVALSSGQNRRVSRTAPRNFSAKPSFHASSGRSRKAPARVAPAELTRMSQRPCRSLTVLNRCSQASSLRRSPATVIGAAPPLFIVSAAAARFAADEAARTRLAPSRANACATARPMPRLPPVTTTTFPAKSPGIAFLPLLVSHLRQVLQRRLDQGLGRKRALELVRLLLRVGQGEDQRHSILRRPQRRLGGRQHGGGEAHRHRHRRHRLVQGIGA